MLRGGNEIHQDPAVRKGLTHHQVPKDPEMLHAVIEVHLMIPEKLLGIFQYLIPCRTDNGAAADLQDIIGGTETVQT